MNLSYNMALNCVRKNQSEKIHFPDPTRQKKRRTIPGAQIDIMNYEQRFYTQGCNETGDRSVMQS